MKKILLALALVAMVGLTATNCTEAQQRSCTEAQQREIKSIKSNWTGGLNRTVTVYDYNGRKIKSWSGQFDVKETDRNSVYFDTEDGKRVIVSGGIIINEEK